MYKDEEWTTAGKKKNEISNDWHVNLAYVKNQDPVISVRRSDFWHSYEEMKFEAILHDVKDGQPPGHETSWSRPTSMVSKYLLGQFTNQPDLVLPSLPVMIRKASFSATHYSPNLNVVKVRLITMLQVIITNIN